MRWWEHAWDELRYAAYCHREMRRFGRADLDWYLWRAGRRNAVRGALYAVRSARYLDTWKTHWRGQ